MKRTVTLLMAAIMVVSLAGMAGGVMAGDETADEADADVRPGERMTGVINVVDAEIQGEVAERGFRISVAQAATADAQADVVSKLLTNVSERLEVLEERQQELNEAHAAGEISDGKHAAKMAKLETERATVERLANQSAAVTADLPQDVLVAHGISIEAIAELRERANELTGQEVADLAKEIAGPSVGEQLPEQAEDRVLDDPGLADDREPGAPEDEVTDDETDVAVDDGE